MEGTIVGINILGIENELYIGKNHNTVEHMKDAKIFKNDEEAEKYCKERHIKISHLWH